MLDKISAIALTPCHKEDDLREKKRLRANFDAVSSQTTIAVGIHVDDYIMNVRRCHSGASLKFFLDVKEEAVLTFTVKGIFEPKHGIV